jgi:hypothetical protein
MNPAENLLNKVQRSVGFKDANENGKRVLTALAALSDVNGIIAGHGVATVAVRAGVSKATATIWLVRLCHTGALMQFKNGRGTVWVIPDSDPDADFL